MTIPATVKRLITSPRIVAWSALVLKPTATTPLPFNSMMRRTGISRLGRSVEDDLVCECRQRGQWRNRLWPASANVEDDPSSTAVRPVGIDDRLPQRSRPAVVRVGDGERRRSSRHRLHSRKLRRVAVEFGGGRQHCDPTRIRHDGRERGVPGSIRRDVHEPERRSALTEA